MHPRLIFNFKQYTIHIFCYHFFVKNYQFFLGNSGSFFKNPIVSNETYEKAKALHPEMPHYVVSETHVKVPAGWLIEQAGFKGKRFGDAGVHKNQALVLVNYGTASGAEILALSRNIQETIATQFGIEIEAEVNII